MRILIAEDDLVSRKLLTRILEDMSHQVISCEDGATAWKLLNEDSSIRCVISDWMMPDMDGVELCRRVRANQDREYTYFVLLTARSKNKSNLTEVMMAGVDDFLNKPLDKDEIWMRLEVAKRILKYTRKINELEQLMPICSYCKKIRNDDNYWEQVDTYISTVTGADFSHSICPTCYDDVIKPQMAQLKKEADAEKLKDS